jgi:multidrug resistance efflux pump
MAEAQAAERENRDGVERRLARLRLETSRPAPPARRRRPRLWLTAAAGAGAVGLAVWALQPAPPPPFAVVAEAPGAAATAAPAPAVVPAIPSAVVLGGYVRAHRQVHLGAAVSGVIRAMYAKPGSQVVEGQRIAELANDTLKAQVDQARATADARQAELDELRNGPRPEELQRAAAEVAEARAAALLAERDLERQRALAGEGLIAAAEAERAEEARAVNRARLEAALQSEGLLREGARSERLRAAEAALAEAQAALGLATAQLEQTVIRSPIDGVVTKQHAEVGELVSAGFGGGAAAAIVTVADVSRLIVEVDVPHAELRRIRLGQPARVESEALAGRRFDGVVTWIGPEANRQKLAVPIEVEIGGAADGLLPGLSAKVTLATEPTAIEGGGPR